MNKMIFDESAVLCLLRKGFNAFVLILFLMAKPVFAQSTTITASNIHSSFNTLLSQGYLCLPPVNAVNSPISFQLGGNGGFSTPQQVCYPVANGAFTSPVVVPDTATTNPPIGYLGQVQNSSHSVIGEYPSQLFPTGPTWNLDAWSTATPTNILTLFAYSATAPNGRCRTPSVTYTSENVYGCVAGTWVLITTVSAPVSTPASSLTGTALPPSITSAPGLASTFGAAAAAYSSNASNLTSGTIAIALIPTLNQSTTGNAATATAASEVPASGITGTALPGAITSAPGVTSLAGGAVGTAAFQPSSAFATPASVTDAQSAAISAAELASDPAGTAAAQAGAALASAQAYSSNASNLTSGTVPAGLLPEATSSAFGAVKPDGSTITISGGIISATGSGSNIAKPTVNYAMPISNGSPGSYSYSTTAFTTDGLGLQNGNVQLSTAKGFFIAQYPTLPNATGATADQQTYYNSYMGKCYTYAQPSSDYAVRENMCNKYMGLYGHVSTSGNTATWVDGNMYLGLVAGDTVTVNGVTTQAAAPITQTSFNTVASLGTNASVVFSTPNQNASYVISSLGEPLTVTASAQLEVGSGANSYAPTLEFPKNFNVDFGVLAIANQPAQSNALMLFPGASTYSVGHNRGQGTALVLGGNVTNSMYACVSTMSTTNNGTLDNAYFRPSGVECYAPSGITSSGYLFQIIGGADMSQEVDLGGDAYGFRQGTYTETGGVVTMTSGTLDVSPARYAPILLAGYVGSTVAEHPFLVSASGTTSSFTSPTTSVDGATLLNPVLNLTAAAVSGASTTVFTGTGISGVPVGGIYSVSGFSLAGCNITGPVTSSSSTSVTITGTGCTTAQSGATATATYQGAQQSLTAAAVSGSGFTVYTTANPPANIQPGSMYTVSGFSLAGCNGTFNASSSNITNSTITLVNSGCSAAQTGATATIQFAPSYLYSQNGFHHSGGCCNHIIKNQYFDGYGGSFPDGGVSDVIDTSASSGGLYEYDAVTSNHAANGFPVSIIQGINSVNYTSKYDEINGTSRSSVPVNIDNGGQVTISGTDQIAGTNGNTIDATPAWYLGTTTGGSLDITKLYLNSNFAPPFACAVMDMNRPTGQQCTPSDQSGYVSGYRSNKYQTPTVINDVQAEGSLIAGQALGGTDGPLLSSTSGTITPVYQTTPVSGTGAINTIVPTSLPIACQGMTGTASTNGTILSYLTTNPLGAYTTPAPVTTGWLLQLAGGATQYATAGPTVVSTGTLTISGTTLTYVSGYPGWALYPYPNESGLTPNEIISVTQSGTTSQLTIATIPNNTTATVVANPSGLSGTFTYVASYAPLVTAPANQTSVSFVATRPQQADCRITLLGEGSANSWTLGTTGDIGEARSGIGGAADLIFDPTDVGGCATPYNGYGCFHRIQ